MTRMGRVSLLLDSGLLDVGWYEAVTGLGFVSAEECAAHVVEVGMPDRLSPSPFLDLVCMPAPVRRAWRTGRIGVVLEHLRSDEGREKPCGVLFDPRQVPGELPLAAFLAAADASTLLPLPPSRVARSLTVGEARTALMAPPAVLGPARPQVPGRTSVVVVDEAGDWRTTERAVRSVLDNTPGADLEVLVLTVGQARPVRQATTAAYVGVPQVRVHHLEAPPAGELPTTGDAILWLPPETRVRRGWLAPLREALAAPGVAAAHPLLLDRTDLVAGTGPLLGHPKEDAARLAGRDVAATGPVLVAAGSPSGAHRLAPTSLVSWNGEEAPVLDGELADADGRQRWGIRTPSTAGVWGDDWGDTHFAESLARAIRSAGHDAVTYRRDALDAPVRALDDVCLAIRGLEPVPPVPGRRNVLWIISHPEEVTAAELAGYDLVFAASPEWARDATARFGREVRPLEQATEVDDSVLDLALEPAVEAVFVGGASTRPRPMVDLALEAGIPLAVHGHGWDRLPAGTWRSRHVPNQDLPRLYARHPLVLADHWPDMAADGFIANRVYDAAAAGALVATDPVRGIEARTDLAAVVCRTAADLRAAYERALGEHRTPARLAAARRVCAEHSFGARVRVLDEAVSLLG